MASGLPFDSGELGIAAVMIENLSHQLRKPGGVVTVRVWIGDEPSSTRECDHTNQAQARNGDSTRGFRVSPQLLVVCQEKVVEIRHSSPVS
jgi:hypothetical protein